MAEEWKNRWPRNADLHVSKGVGRIYVRCHCDTVGSVCLLSVYLWLSDKSDTDRLINLMSTTAAACEKEIRNPNFIIIWKNRLPLFAKHYSLIGSCANFKNNPPTLAYQLARARGRTFLKSQPNFGVTVLKIVSCCVGDQCQVRNASISYYGFFFYFITIIFNNNNKFNYVLTTLECVLRYLWTCVRNY